jgi:hypothetical protein
MVVGFIANAGPWLGKKMDCFRRKGIVASIIERRDNFKDENLY